MKRLIVFALLLLVAVAVRADTLTYDGDYFLKQISFMGASDKRVNPIYLALEEIDDYLDGTSNWTYIDFTPATAPTGAEGRVYYNDTANTLQVYTGSAWVSLATSAGNSLDAAYDVGSKIDVDGTVLELEVDDASNNSALYIDHDEATNDNTAVLIENAADAANAITIDIDAQATGRDIEGTSASWYVTGAGLGVFTGINSSADSTISGAAYNIEFDVSRNDLHFEDNAVLAIGGADNAAGDITFTYDGTDLLIEAAAANDDWKMGATTNFDVTIYGQTATNYWKFDTDDAALTMIFENTHAQFNDADYLKFGSSGDITFAYDGSGNDLDILGSGLEIAFGVDDEGLDIVWHTETSGDNVTFDESGMDIDIVDVDLGLDDDSYLQFGTSDDIIVKYAGGTNILEITQTVADTGSITFGADGTDIPTKWFGETAGDYFQITGDDVVLEDMSLVIADGTQIQFGDAVGTGQMYMSISTAALTIGQVAAGTGTLLIGADNKGIDTTFYAETAGDYVKWDQDGASNLGALIFEDSVLQFAGANVTYSEAISTDALAFTATDHANAQITIGTTGTTNGLDVVWNTKTAGAEVTFDAGALETVWDGTLLRINDDDDLAFGNSGEAFVIEYDEDGTDNLVITAAAASDAVQIGDGTTLTDLKLISSGDALAPVHYDASGDTNNGQLLLGADDHGVDLILFGATASQKAWWDQSADTWYFGADAEGVDVYFYADTTGDLIQWNEDAAAETLTFVDVNASFDNGSYVMDMGTTGTKALVGTPVIIEFRPTAAETLTWKVPTQVDLLVTDAWGFKIAANGSHADDELTIQNNDGSAAAIFTKEELSGVNDTVRFAFDGLDDTEMEVEGGNSIDLLANEGASVDCIVYIQGIYKTAD